MEETTTGAPDQPEPSPIAATNPEPDLDLLFRLASRGDAEAQAAMALNAMQVGISGAVPKGDAFACAELYARMAAGSGQPEHVMVLAAVLASRYDHIGNVGLDEDAFPPLIEHFLCLKIAAETGHAGAITNLRTLTDITAAVPTAEGLWTEITAALSTAPQAEAEAVATDQAPADAV